MWDIIFGVEIVYFDYIYYGEKRQNYLFWREENWLQNKDNK